MKKSKTAEKHRTQNFSTRHLRVDLLLRLRRLAERSDGTLEDALNKTLAIGLKVYEKGGANGKKIHGDYSAKEQ